MGVRGEQGNPSVRDQCSPGPDDRPEPVGGRRPGAKVILSVVAVLVLLSGGVAVATSLGSGPATPTAEKSAMAGPGRATPAPSATPAAGTPDAIKSWFDHGGKTALDNIGDDLIEIKKGAQVADRTENGSQIALGCSDLQYALTQARPIPDAPAEQAFAKALAYWKAAAADCLTAVSGGGSSLLGKSAQDETLGNAWCLKAMKILAGLISVPPVDLMPASV
jgi:hypothetical protein